MRQIFRSVVSAVAMFAAALILNACADGTATVIRQAGPAGSECSPVGSTAAAYNCGGLSCSAGFTPGRVCESTATGGRWAATCSCVPMPNPDAGAQNPPGTVVAGTACTEGQRHYARWAVGMMTCPSGQLLIAECLPQGPGGSLIWAVGQTSCHARLSRGTFCDPALEPTFDARCGTCNGATGRRLCDADGMGYGPCAPCNNTQICNPNQPRVGGSPCNPCGAGSTGVGAMYCNADGTAETCRLIPGAMCSSTGGCASGTNRPCNYSCGSTSVPGVEACNNGQWVGTCSPTQACPNTGCANGLTENCSATCNGASTAGTRTCNSGTWSACTPNSCSGGGGGNYSMQLEIPSNFGGNYCNDASRLRVVPYDNRGCPIGREDSATQPIPGTNTACGNSSVATRNQIVSFGDTWNGYVNAQVYCGNVLYRGFTPGQSLRQAGFITASVNRSGIAALVSQLDDTSNARAISSDTVRLNVGPGPLSW